MKLDRAEKVLMNNPIRAAFQRWYEVPLLERLGGRVEGLDVLEIGSGLIYPPFLTTSLLRPAIFRNLR